MKRWLAVAVIVAVFAVGAWTIVTTFAPIATSHPTGGGPFLTGGPATTVIVSTHDISAGTHLDRLIKAGDFRTVEVPSGVVVSGAITSLDQLRGQTTADTIYANEQIPVMRLVGIP